MKNQTNTPLRKRNKNKDFFWNEEVEKKVVDAYLEYKKYLPKWKNYQEIKNKVDGTPRKHIKIIKSEPYWDSAEDKAKYDYYFGIVYQYALKYVEYFLLISRRTKGFEKEFDDLKYIFVHDLFETNAFHRFDPEAIRSNGKKATMLSWLNRCCENAASNVLGKNETPSQKLKYTGCVWRSVSENRNLGEVWNFNHEDPDMMGDDVLVPDFDLMVDAKYESYQDLYQSIDKLITVDDDFKEEVLKPLFREWYWDVAKNETNFQIIADIKKEAWDAQALLSDYTEYPVTTKEVNMLRFALRELRDIYSGL